MEIFLVVGLALLGGFLLILVSGIASKKGKNNDISPQRTLNLLQFKKACRELIEVLKLSLEEEESNETRIDILARNPAPRIGGLLLIRGLYQPPSAIVPTTDVLEFSNMIVQERVMKGILITTGRFSPEVKTIPELAPMELIDGEELTRLIAAHQIILL